MSLTKTTTRTDGDTTRTALVIEESNDGGSIDLLDGDGTFIARVNIFRTDTWLGVDVIDVENKFPEKHVLTFKGGRRESLECGQVGAVDFRGQ
jgi:hypothetical protein